ncbi:NF038122 family metalloprotease [Bradyrhizobium commune]|uniref:NF038122 family metalloprotease n=1 Tax=Bradyrhizobium commune TaxID=83627 RepID=A0A7S9D9W6_9BRAD|nr:NF038122 family metalloprotease [Bradyrhizobium commune]QPF93852.1 NF038122 family metalloprotease [Bradyrhizobium commune]
MTSASGQDQDLLSEDPIYTVVGTSIQGSYIPATSGGSSGGSSSGSVMSVTSGGITINLILDAAAQAAPASFKNGLQQAVSILAANITDHITVNIKIDYSGTGGGAAAGPDYGYYESYAWTHSELVNNATAGDTTFNSLPGGSTIQGQSNVAVWNAQLKLWGVIGANDTTTDDASAYFSTDINPNLLVGVALHELTHALGRVPYGSAPDVFDLYRFTSPGVRLFSGGSTAPEAYFSLDNGATKIADYGQTSDPSDFLNSGVQGPNDPFNEFYTGGTTQTLSSIDLKQLDALGFHLAINSPGMAAQPDLSEYVAVDKTTVAAGSSLTIDAYNMNLGDAVAGPSTAKIYLSTDATITTSDTLLATVSTSTTLATVSQPGYYDHQTIMVALPGNLAPGTYYIGGIADYNNQIGERDETNNTYNVVQITITAGHPDLSEYVAVDKTTVVAGSSLTIDAYDMNLGDGVDATSTTAGIYLSTDATITTSDTLLTTLTTSATLAAVSLSGYYDHQATTVTLPGNLAPGTYYIGGIADYNNHLTESNETNNTYNVVQVTVTAPAQPDLTEYVAVNHTSVAAGDSVTIDAYNMNLGSGVASSPNTAGIYLSTDATITTSDTLLTTLTTSSTLATVSQPGYYDHQTVTVALPGNLAPGTYYIGGIADYNNHVTESNETNNTYNVVQVTVAAPARPDLSEYVAVDRTTVAAGSSLTVDAYNMNLGNAVASSPNTAGIYLSTDATITTSDTLLTTLTTSSTLATVSQPGYYDHQTVTVTLPGNLAPGTYYIGGLADYNNQLAESNETNNAYNVVQVTVTAPGSSSTPQASVASSSTGAAYFGNPNVQDNFALAQAGDVQPLGVALVTDHASLATTVSLQAQAGSTDVAIHFVFDHLTDVAQHYFGDYHLV